VEVLITVKCVVLRLVQVNSTHCCVVKKSMEELFRLYQIGVVIAMVPVVAAPVLYQLLVPLVSILLVQRILILVNVVAHHRI